MDTLRLYLPAGPVTTALPWALRDGSGQVRASGEATDPWPVAHETELVLGAGRTRFVRGHWPVGALRNQDAALGFALEPGLINDPGDNRYRLVETDGWVALTAAAPLSQLESLLQAQGLELLRIVPEEMLLPVPAAGQWSLAALADGWLLRQAVGQGQFVPQSLAALAGTLGLPEQGFCLYGRTGLPSPWLSVQQSTAAPYCWRTAPAHAAINFASGRRTLRQVGRRMCQLLWRMAWMLVLLLVLASACDLAELGFLKWRQWSLGRQMVAQAQLMAAPARHASQALALSTVQLERVRAQHGLPLRRGALSMISTLEQALGAGLRLESLDYRTQRLHFRAQPLSETQLQRGRSVLAQHRLRLEADADGQWLLQVVP
jgi:general secretion pathway protein L